MQKVRPKIGYTTKDFSVDVLQWAIAFSIFITGGKPVRLHPRSPKYGHDIDGLVIGGGTDLYPPLYRLDPKPDYVYDRERDKLEMEWLAHAEEKNLPILGICRGAQLMNVHRGGTLHTDVAKVYENAKYPSGLLARVFFRKKALINSDSLLFSLIRKETARVNSMHKQALDKIGDSLIISAKENNGVVQAIEDQTRTWYMGVQFHPEVLIYRKAYWNIFRDLVKAAKPEKK